MDKIIIEIDNITKEQKIALESLFYQMESLGNLGGSRWLCFYSDGDGNYRPKIKINGRKPRHTKSIPTEILWETDEYRIDFDNIQIEKEFKL